MSHHYDLYTEELLEVLPSQMAGNSTSLRTQELLDLFESGTGLLDSASGFVNSANELVNTSEALCYAAMDLYRSVKELEFETARLEAYTKLAIQKAEKGSEMTRSKIERNLDKCDMLLLQVLSIDVDTCSERQWQNRERLIEMLTMFSDHAHKELMAYLRM